MEEKALQELVLSLLEPGIYKTTDQVVQELRAEHSRIWHELEREGEMLYGGGCSSVQQPPTRIAQALLSLPPEKCLCRLEKSLKYWSKAPAHKGAEA